MVGVTPHGPSSVLTDWRIQPWPEAGWSGLRLAHGLPEGKT